MSHATRRTLLFVAVALVIAVAVVAVLSDDAGKKTSTGGSTTTSTSSGTVGSTASSASPTGMPAVIDPKNIYSEQTAGKLDHRVAGDKPMVYVPNGLSNTVTMIDPATKKVVGSFAAGKEPQHIVPSYDMRTL